MSKSDLRSFINGVLVFVAGFFLCIAIDSKINQGTNYSDFSGLAMLFTAGVVTYSAGQIIAAIKDQNKDK